MISQRCHSLSLYPLVLHSQGKRQIWIKIETISMVIFIEAFAGRGKGMDIFFFNKTLKNSVYISRWLSPFLNFFLWNAFKKMESYQPKVASCLVTGCDTDEGALERSLRMIPVQAWDIFKTSWFSTSLRW